MKKIFVFLFFMLTTLLGQELKAQDLVYQPKNPAFGGSYLNYSWMLSSAQAQNKIEDPEQSSSIGRDPLEDFESNLNRQILNQLSRRIIESQFGEEGLDDGEYTLGSYRINVGSQDGGVNINIYDNSTGNSTEVIVPYY